MKKVILSILIVFAISIVSCSKSDGTSPTTSESFVECKINGENQKFNIHTSANDGPQDHNNVFAVVVAGFAGNDLAKSNSFGFNLMKESGGITPGTYEINEQLNPTYTLSGTYTVRGATTSQDKYYYGGGLEGTSFKLTISSMTQKGVKGTFSGVLKNVETDEKLIVTEGKFAANYN